MPCWAATQENKTGVKINKGEAAPFSGYLFTERTTKDIAQGWKDSEAQFRILSRAYDDLKRESLESVHELQKEVFALNEALLNETNKQRRANRRKTFWNVAGALLIGGAIGIVAHNN